MARTAIFVLLVTVNAVLGSQSSGIFQNDSNIATTHNYYPKEKLNLVTLGVVNGKKYFFSNDLATWYAASYFCNAHGMDLASIETQHENELIMEQISKLGTANNTFWISGHKIGRTSWLWINGDIILFTDWETGEPSDPELEHCILIQNNKWQDYMCEYPYGFICEEREVVTASESLERSIYPDDLLNLVTLDPSTGKKYLFAHVSANWFESSYFCTAYDMDLVTIETQKENDLIMAHIDFLGMTKGKDYWTSAHNIGRFSWLWINGENMIFSDWGSGQPSDNNNHCMFIYWGVWNNAYCYFAFNAFICESRELPPDNSTEIINYYPADMMNLVNLGPGAGKKYIFSDQISSWFDASYFCNVHGMDLLTIETQEENDAIINHLGIIGSDLWYWTSGHKIGRATYLWINGEYILYNDWAPGEPSEYEFNCMLILNNGWYDQSCNYLTNFICEERIISE